MFKYYVYNFQALTVYMKEITLRQVGHVARTGEAGIF